MNTKLIALGNILMKDDGIAVKIARRLEQELEQSDIEVIYGETDIGYCISRIDPEACFILLDASFLGKQAGEITMLSLRESYGLNPGRSQHDISLIELIHLYYPKAEGIILAIEAAEIGYGIEISTQLNDRLEEISEEVLTLAIGYKNAALDIK